MPASKISPEGLLVPLATAHGDLEVVQKLIKGQYRKRLLQLRMMIDRGISELPAADVSRLLEWYTLLLEVERVAPEVLRSILLDPDVAAWFETRGINVGAVVGRITAAAAVLSSLSAAVAVPLQGEELFLPCLGTVIVDEANGDAVVLVSANDVTVTAGEVEIRLPRDLAQAAGRWRPVRWLKAGKRTTLKARFATDGPVHDAFRKVYPAEPRVPHNEEDWQLALSEGWQILETKHAAHAASIAAGVRALVPAVPKNGASSASATLGEIFGATALSLPHRPDAFAMTLIHEMQHAKLNAALDLIQLYTADDDAKYYAPWRPDPRPLAGLLQGIYAHLGIAQFWGAQGQSADDPEDSMLAFVEFVRWRDDTWQACSGIVGAPSLTEAGALFVNNLLDELDRLRAQDVPPEARRIAGLISYDHQVSWRLRNLDVDEAAARSLAEAWLDDREAFSFPAQCIQRRHTPRMGPGKRIEFVYRNLTDHIEEPQENLPDADVLYARGDYSGALETYQKRIAENPADIDAWGGIAVSMFAKDNVAPDALSIIPEVVAETYKQAARISSTPRPPLHLAEWLNRAAYDRMAVEAARTRMHPGS